MSSNKILEIKKNSYPGSIGIIFQEMQNVRAELKQQIKDISQEMIDYTPEVNKFETIGTQILHIADSENWWIRKHINKEIYNTEKWKYAVALQDNLIPRQLTGQRLEFYIGLLNEVRSNTEKVLSKFKEKDGKEVFKSELTEATLEWVLYHIQQHESHHIGQINLLKRLYKLNQNISD